MSHVVKDKDVDRQTRRQTDRQTGKQTDRQTEAVTKLRKRSRPAKQKYRQKLSLYSECSLKSFYRLYQLKFRRLLDVNYIIFLMKKKSIIVRQSNTDLFSDPANATKLSSLQQVIRHLLLDDHF